MLIKTLVLDCNKRVDKLLRDVVNINPNAVLFTVQSLIFHPIARFVLRINDRGHIKLVVFDIGYYLIAAHHFINGIEKIFRSPYEKHRENQNNRSNKNAKPVKRFFHSTTPP